MKSYAFIRVTTEARDKLKIAAALRGVSMIDLLKILADRELEDCNAIEKLRERYPKPKLEEGKKLWGTLKEFESEKKNE